MAKKTGRPSDYNTEIADKLCARIAAGESVRAICADAEMPCEKSVYRWLAAHESFRQQYAHARERQMEFHAEQLLEIADDTSRDTVTKKNHDGSETEVCDHEWIARSRLRVDARKWLMSKLAPKKYGDAMTVSVNYPMLEQDIPPPGEAQQ